jgi:hypothetical protein
MKNLSHKIKTVADSLERERELVAKQRLVIQQLEKDLAEVQEMITQHENLIQSQETNEVIEEERVMYQYFLQLFHGQIRSTDMQATSMRLLHISLFSMKSLEKIIPSGRQYFLMKKLLKIPTNNTEIWNPLQSHRFTVMSTSVH